MQAYKAYQACGPGPGSMVKWSENRQIDRELDGQIDGERDS